ncbi:hypothetical protein [Sphingobium indicum]|uniref:hypothetical protein n=1 Tax=Sphingobium indicum TaxID=332055 RepID=UPI0005662E03|nr:hypothetical protein [Sphingobium indicum]
MAVMDNQAPDLFISIARSLSDDTLDRIVRNAQLQIRTSELEAASLAEVARRHVESERAHSVRTPERQNRQVR